MSGVFLAFGVAVALLIAVNLIRVAVGPTLFDRLLAVNVIGTKSILLLLLAGLVFGRVELFVDLAIAYALLSFVGVVAAAKYLDLRREAAE